MCQVLVKSKVGNKLNAENQPLNVCVGRGMVKVCGFEGVDA